MDIFSEELGDAGGFLEVVYREVCTNHSEEMLDIQEKKIEDSETLLRIFSGFTEATFATYLDAEAPVLRKNKDRSTSLREKGNKEYGSKNLFAAIEFYNKAIRFAPYTVIEGAAPNGQGSELALAYANRSAASVGAADYRSGLVDIELALTAGYPKDLQYKLYERACRCHELLGEHQLALQAARTCLTAISSSGLKGEKKANLVAAMTNQIKKFDADPKRDVVLPKETRKNIKPSLSTVNPRFPAFSSAVNISYQEGRGRFGVAVRDIPFGELVALEHPPSSYLHEESTGVNCSNCFRMSPTPLPSPLCTQNVFCSKECQKTGMESYHAIESKFMDVLFQNGLKKKEWFLALRSVTQRPLEYFSAIQSKLDHNPLLGAEKQKDSMEIYETDDFLTLYNLVGHHKLWDVKEHAYKAFFALFFLRCLQRSNYFGNQHIKDHQSLGPDELLIGRILIHLMEVATMNSHEIGQVEKESGRSWLQGTTQPVGCALEPTMVLLNHSCNPNLTRVNDGTSTYCFASRNIKKGDEITDSYSQAYDIAPEVERCPILQMKYKFRCLCEACSGHWPTFKNLPKSFNDLPDNQLSLVPQDDPRKFQHLVKEIQILGAKIHRLQAQEDYCSAMAVYPDFMRTLESIIKPPHQFYVIARRSYATCLWVKHGNTVNI